MKILRTVLQMRAWAQKNVAQIGFVPTMGDLHEGHLSLIRRSQKENKKTLVSIFVNPLQFNDKRDFKKYHRTTRSDLQKLKELGADAVFLPTEKMFYPPQFQTTVTVKNLQKPLCGAFRPGHFEGVATVVLKLLNLTQAHRAYFGLKDFQQCRVIQQMAADLNVPVKIVSCPIVREADGLAMSSRNRRLSAAERARATNIYAALKTVEKQIKTNPKISQKILKQNFKKQLSLTKKDRLEYLELINPQTLEPAQKYNFPILIATAVWIGKTRLIDNVVAGNHLSRGHS